MARASAIVVLVLCLALVSCEAVGRGRVGARGGGHRGGGRHGVPALANQKIFNVVQFGARPGGEEDSTQGFMQAWVAACGYNGNARVVVPKGVFKVSELTFGGPCKGTAPIVFQVLGTVKADSDLSNYPDKGWISFQSIDGLVLSGVGTFDGQGQNVWKYNDCSTNPSCVHLPSVLYFNNMKNSRISGLHLVNAMGFHIHMTGSYNMRINGLTITSPGESPNTDGIHVSKSDLVRIAKTMIGTGDDCISIGQGATNIAINMVTCGPGHGISVGSLGKLPHELDVTGIIVKNCTLTGTTNGVRIKTWPGSDPSKASGILFGDIIMNNVENPIIIDQGYGDKSSSKPSKVKISNVVYQNIVGTTSKPAAVNLMCSKVAPCDNLHFNNINLRLTGAGSLSSTCTNAKASYTGLQFPRPCA
ncbi:exopolygalacturonase-like [Actinidia eriantha]|uniref:exopolygalacturonase-like n=1 Tax=Actinidia eriantha TaxID=165200 RepID=UPI00258B33EF|nr:exopolygalacturonase-like [Actinidia eriantha]